MIVPSYFPQDVCSVQNRSSISLFGRSWPPWSCYLLTIHHLARADGQSRSASISGPETPHDSAARLVQSVGSPFKDVGSFPRSSLLS